ncbi:MAG: hypothetical protein FWH14_08790 [Oscillospiraceae bacterium]|nr:hypothetical protein [Oscillospiraceae bacterium]
MANTRNKVAIVFDGVVCPETPSHSVGIWVARRVRTSVRTVLYKPCGCSCLSLWERCHAVA